MICSAVEVARKLLPTPLGPLRAEVKNDHLCGLYFAQHRGVSAAQDFREVGESSLFEELEAQLDAYFGGRLKIFDVPVALEGTPFQTSVWELLKHIPFGTTITYGELARRAGLERGSRAVGAATGKNPVSILVPCHRVVGARGELTGYAGGVDLKHRLLRLEGCVPVLRG